MEGAWKGRGDLLTLLALPLGPPSPCPPLHLVHPPTLPPSTCPHRTNSDLSRRKAAASNDPEDGAGGGEAAARYSTSFPSRRQHSDMSAMGASSSSLREGDKARLSMALLQMTSYGGRASSSELVPEMVDEEEQQRALRRYMRPRMGSSTTLAIPLIERHAADLGAGRLRVSVPDGLEVGEDLLALTPDGRRQLIRLPGGAGSEGGSRHLVFFTDLPQMIWQPALVSQSSC